jgi:hypothetical protein
MKKLYSCLLACLAVLMALFPLLGGEVAAMDGEAMHILESVLPNEQQRGSTTTAPDANGGLPFMPDKETERETDGAAQTGRAAAQAADGDISVWGAVLVVGLALITLIVAVIYVFRGRGERPRRE